MTAIGTQRSMKERFANTRARPFYSDGYMFERLHRARALLGDPLTIAKFDAFEEYRATQVYMDRYGSWADILEAAGFPAAEVAAARERASFKPRGFGEARYSGEAVRTAYVRIRDLARRPPTVDEWETHRIDGEPVAPTLRKRYTSWSGFIREMVAMDECGRQPATQLRSAQ